MAAIGKDHLPEKYHSKFTNYPLPVARLARLAVDQKFQNQGLATLLLADALLRCTQLSDAIGMIGVLVDAKNEGARHWYERFEFEHFPDHPLTLRIPLSALLTIQRGN